MTREEIIALIEDAVAADHGKIRGTEALDEIAWDSMATLSFIALVDERVHREIEATVVAKCRTVAELIALLLDTTG